LSSGISANILDFGNPQKHVLNGMMAMDTGLEADRSRLVAEVQAH